MVNNKHSILSTNYFCDILGCLILTDREADLAKPRRKHEFISEILNLSSWVEATDRTSYLPCKIISEMARSFPLIPESKSEFNLCENRITLCNTSSYHLTKNLCGLVALMRHKNKIELIILYTRWNITISTDCT